MEEFVANIGKTHLAKIMWPFLRSPKGCQLLSPCWKGIITSSYLASHKLLEPLAGQKRKRLWRIWRRERNWKCFSFSSSSSSIWPAWSSSASSSSSAPRSGGKPWLQSPWTRGQISSQWRMAGHYSLRQNVNIRHRHLHNLRLPTARSSSLHLHHSVSRYHTEPKICEMKNKTVLLAL